MRWQLFPGKDGGWYRWFAWYPISIYNGKTNRWTTIWWEWVERSWRCGPLDDEYWAYRLIDLRKEEVKP